MNISIAVESDLEQLLELQKACYLEEAILYNDFTITPLTQTFASIQLDFQKEVFFKMEFDGKIIGSVRGHVESDTCIIGKLFVHKEFQNQGLGKILMKSIEAHFEKTKRFELFTGYKSEKNLLLYKKLGYSEYKQQYVHKNQCRLVKEI
ncbi:GNAT family N-acetyltransferase [uncultured Cytophaga sp.]|uniref:GNAT family N-acetyltransferase n=1 Tax=uncultured Cytophaga sp. TaxID=160238 RepID=UPI002613915F|nr:GNAT family N-acetyltransferase [uncultured Cytophaga sp.]